ncbi:MAG TPA: methylmalonyl Co-A mutase-associated GTPase MeaB [Chloroflexi bacterium]|nr:methylmalonyl Co-A mutase-associated GTPase MeaB [Chloroflexota bacterium]
MTSSLSQQILNRKRRAIARLITYVENNHPKAQQALSELYPHTGQAHLVGVTGAPGTGKSSLVNEIAKAYRRQDISVAILAIDPTSPFSGGAILGDRIRMRELTGDPGVFIRSMASRGNLGGLARAAHDAIKVLDAAGFEVILIETVGAGQSEVEIARTAHTVLVVEAPGLGDDIQAIKAGILEIADIFVVNKADRPGADKTAATLKTMLELGRNKTQQIMHHGALMTINNPLPPSQDDNNPGWQIPVIQTIALKGDGVEGLMAAISNHRQRLIDSGELSKRNRARLADELEALLQAELMRRLTVHVPAETLSDIIAKLVARSLSPYNAMQIILEDYCS